MSRRDLERWVAASRDRLESRRITVLFGFGPSIGRDGGASWASFISPRGTGRFIRANDGASRVDVYAFVDGACLKQEREDDASELQLEQIVDLLTA